MIHRFFFVVVVLGAVIGCRQPANPPAKQAATDTPAQSIRLLVIEDAEMARAIERQWTAHGENLLQVRLLAQADFFKEPPRRLAADVVIYPSTMIGELVGRDWLQPLEEAQTSSTAFQWRDIWEWPRLQEIKWGSATLAVPLGSPTLMLCYRPDVFEAASLKVPATWHDYDTTVAALGGLKSLRIKDREVTALKTFEPVGFGWAAEMLLARAAAYAKHPSQFSTLFDYRDMKPLIDGPPFVRALKEMIPAEGRSELDWNELRKADVEHLRQLLMDDKCAMAITWPSPQLSDARAAATFPIAFAPLPGSEDVYNFRTATWEKRARSESASIPLLGVSGRLASATKECRNLSVAMKLMMFIAGPEVSGQVSSASKHTTPFRESHLGQINRWLGDSYDQQSAQQYGETVKQLLNQPTALPTLRVRGRQRYMAALDDAVWSAITSKAEAADALRGVAAQWEKITDELGRDAQRRAYTLSIGLEP